MLHFAQGPKLLSVECCRMLPCCAWKVVPTLTSNCAGNSTRLCERAVNGDQRASCWHGHLQQCTAFVILGWSYGHRWFPFLCSKTLYAACLPLHCACHRVFGKGTRNTVDKLWASAWLCSSSSIFKRQAVPHLRLGWYAYPKGRCCGASTCNG